jgi:hypothetical protein
MAKLLTFGNKIVKAVAAYQYGKVTILKLLAKIYIICHASSALSNSK